MTFGGIFIVGFFLINLVTVDWLSVLVWLLLFLVVILNG